MRFLVTAGPTREYLDDVRYLSNPSSGRMGFACAAAAASAGHQVTLVTGPVDLPDPRSVTVVRVISAIEMRAAAMKAFPRAEVVIATAAVCDYRPARRIRGKMKKDARRAVVDLVKTPDILAEMGANKRGRLLIGFALEVRRARLHAIDKMKRKHLDAVVLNDPSSFGRERIDATLITPAGDLFRGAMTKPALARRLVRFAERERGA